MPSFDDMKQMYSTATLGQKLKENSDMIMQLTFDRDISTRKCYIYDYFHDDQSDKRYGYDPHLSKTKTPVKLKFIIKEYKTLSKDDPEAHIMFEPDVWNRQSCVPDYFENMYGKWDVTFPVGLFVDIPDDRGVYHKWLICYKEPANQNVKLGVIRCNYYFTWIEDDGLNRTVRRMWGVERAQNSYTSGVWRGDKEQSLDNQAKFWLPWNHFTYCIQHDDRFIISMPQPKPFCYVITKISNTSPKGVIEFTLKQDLFNPKTDYVNLDTGEMIADYYSSIVTPLDNQTTIPSVNDNDINISIESTSSTIGIGYNKNVAVTITTNGNETIDNSQITWTLLLQDSQTSEFYDVTHNQDIITSLSTNGSKIQFMIDNENYVNSVLKVMCTYQDVSTSQEFNIVY